VEIVVTLSIIVILASILIAAINPNAILKRSRDVTRVQDLDTIDKAIQVMKIEISNFDELNYASQNIVYISLKDSSTTCGSYINQLPSLPSGWQYRCSNSPTNIDGTGWIPFPFNQVPILTLSKLPVDPINKPPYYYAFIVGGSFSLFTMLEDTQRTPNSKNDGDNFPHLYSTVNSNKNLINQAQGLVGYWSFDEGSGNIARDYSGNGNNGTLYNFNFTATSGWVDGKVGKALSFDGVDDYVTIGKNDSIFPNTFLSWIVWIKPNYYSLNGVILWDDDTQAGGDRGIELKNSGRIGAGDVFNDLSNSIINLNQWYFIVYTSNSSNRIIYINGNLDKTFSGSLPDHTNRSFLSVGSGHNGYRGYFNGLIDEVRVYNRALSDSEIKALYEATK
jgi:hypothetical protein